MRFLCLHGYGTNSQILKASFAPIRAGLPQDWEFKFLDGEMETRPGPGRLGDKLALVSRYILTNPIGIDTIFPGPYFAYHKLPSPLEMHRAYDLVMDVVNEEGPFDGIIGFSQGAALAATIIVTEAMRNTGQSLFRVAVFFSATMPYDLSAGKLTVSSTSPMSLKLTYHDASGEEVLDENRDWSTDLRTAWTLEELQSRQHLHPDDYPSVYSLQGLDLLLRYHPSVTLQRIRMPTVHVVGLNDEFMKHGKALADMCESKIRRVVTHEGGHHLPKERVSVGKICEAIVWATERAIFQS